MALIAALLSLAAASFILLLPTLPSLALLWPLSGVLLLCFFLRRAWAIPLVCVCMISMSCIAHLHWLCSWTLSAADEEQDRIVEVAIQDVPVKSEFGLRYSVKLMAFAGQRLPWWQSPTLLLNCAHPDCQAQAGESWRLLVRLRKPHGSVNFSGFDYEQYLFARHVRATGSVVITPVNQRLQSAAVFSIDRWRARMRQALADMQLTQAPIIAGLSLGLDDDISVQDWDLMRATGTTHLIAISGLHIVMVAAIIGGLCGRLWRLYSRACHFMPAQKVAVLSGVLAGLFYGAVSGFSVPTVRALIMAAVLAWTYWQQRKVSSFAVLACTVMLLVFCDPCAILQAGFWLSCAAVAVLLFVDSGRLQPPAAWRNAVRLQFYLCLSLLPLTYAFFGQISLLAPFANLVAVPFLGSLVTPLALLGVALSLPLPSLSHWLLQLCDQAISLFLWLMSTLAAWPWASVQLPTCPVLSLVFLCSAVVLLLLPGAMAMRWPALALVAVALGLIGQQAKPFAALTILDVGQGLAITLETSRSVLVFDTGPRSARFDAGSDVVAAALFARGYRHVDWVFVSHADNDHAGGVLGLQRSMNVEHWRSGEPVPGISTIPCRSGQQLQLDGVQVELLSPASAGAGNKQSCVMRVSIGNTVVLMPGDIEKVTELNLAHNDAQRLRADILIAPHHGSLTSSTEPFLDAVQASQIVVSAGYHNRFDHPRPAVMQRYREHGAQVLNTANSGAVRWEWATATSKPELFLARSERRIWRAVLPNTP